MSRTNWALCALVFLVCLPRANAAATLLLEEPFGHLGAVAKTGHSAVYLSNVCAASPVVLRKCRSGEWGAVISRYNKVGNNDWFAIPLMAYLYAVDNPDDAPLFADDKIVAFLRDQYRRKYLEAVAPDGKDNQAPGGNWIQLVGSAYDRTIYGYEIETSPKRDEEFIRRYNARPNRPQYRAVSRNCADFAREVMNFYYPKALHRSITADLGIDTPKQAAKSMVQFSKRHQDFRTASFVIPQVPGIAPRSTPVYGLVESFVKTKKYLLPLAVFHPFVAGGIACVYVEGGRFNPARNALIMDANRELQPPLNSGERRSYRNQLALLMNGSAEDSTTWRKGRPWQKFQDDVQPELDASGHLILRLRTEQGWVELGISRSNILTTQAPSNLTEELLAARLQEELRGNAPESDILEDWRLLKQTMTVEVASSAE
jgi:hypothetical protein